MANAYIQYENQEFIIENVASIATQTEGRVQLIRGRGDDAEVLGVVQLSEKCPFVVLEEPKKP